MSSDGTEFGLDFFFVQVHNRDVDSAQLICKSEPVHPNEFRCLAERKLSNLEKAYGQLEFQFCLDHGAGLTARDQEVVRILDCQFSHSLMVLPINRASQGCFSSIKQPFTTRVFRNYIAV